MITSQVVKDPFHDGTVFLEQPYGPVAVAAQQPPDALAATRLAGAAGVVMVYSQPFPERVPLRADSADAALARQQCVVRLDGDAVEAHQPPAEPALLRTRKPVPLDVVAPDALACPVGSAPTARAPDPFILRPRSRPRSHGDARAEQRVPHGRFRRAQLFGYRLMSRTIRVTLRDISILLQRKLPSASHADII